MYMIIALLLSLLLLYTPLYIYIYIYIYVYIQIIHSQNKTQLLFFCRDPGFSMSFEGFRRSSTCKNVACTPPEGFYKSAIGL